ncbi:MAG TPA: hypothetical protein VMT17_11935 [Anaeromyxobacteraceae bacterium]|nr:hypothetical protein [Anaeromyxobacteraceae bacterium]
MDRPHAARVALLLAVASPGFAHAEAFEVNPNAGNNTFSAVFDAKLGERINAVSSAVGCQLTYDENSGMASGSCSVPLASIRVDNDDTKSGHFREWSTNKKTDPATCKLEATFANVKVGQLQAGRPASFTASIPFTICGKTRADGQPEKVSGTVLVFPPGAYGERKTVRIRAAIASFDRDAYRIGPKYTDGWLARVQQLAPVVAQTGTIDLSLFAKAK